MKTEKVGMKRNKRRREEQWVLADGSSVSDVTDVELRRIRAAGLSPSEKAPVTLLNRCSSWSLIADCLKYDDLLQATLREFSETFDVNFALDAAVLEAVCGTSDGSDAVVELARTVSRQMLGSTSTSSYLTEMYRRLLTWCVSLGGCPVCYISQHLASSWTTTGEEPRRKGSRSWAESRWRAEETQFARFESTWHLMSDVGEAVRTFSNVNNASARELVSKMRAAPRAAAMTALEYLKWYRDGHVPFIPCPDTLKLSLLFDHREKRLLAVDERETVYREFVWLTHPPTTVGDEVHVPEEDERRVLLCSPVLECSRDSRMYRHLKRQYFLSAYINSKRSVLVGPSMFGSGGEARTSQDGLLSKTNREEIRISEILADYVQKLSEKFPNQMYGDLTRSTRTAEETARMNMATYLSETGPGASFMSSATRPANYVGTNEILETFEDHAKRRILSDFRVMLDTFKGESRSYESILRFISAYCDGSESTVREAYENMSLSDRDAVSQLIRSSRAKALEERRRDLPEMLRELEELDTLDKPEVHRVESAGKLLGMYTTTVGISDLEDLHHMWDTMWKSKLSGMSLFTRRRNTIQYTNANPQMSGARAAAALFCNVTNVAGFVVLVPMHRTRFRDTNLSMNDLFVMDKFLKPTPTVRSLMAYNMSALPSDVHMKPSEEVMKMILSSTSMQQEQQEQQPREQKQQQLSSGERKKQKTQAFGVSSSSRALLHQVSKLSKEITM